jgi:hypothetical protein
MQRILMGALALVLGIAACSSDSTEGNPLPTTNAQLSIVNALPVGSNATLRLDASTVALPASGTTSRIPVTSGTHQLQVQTAAGHLFTGISFSVDPDSTRTVVVSGGVDTAVVSVAIDSNITGPGQPVPTTGHILMVNSAPGVGPFDVTVTRAALDSTLRFGGFSFGVGTPQSPSPLQYSFPFQPDTYTFDITNPGSNTPLASTVVTLATGDNWLLVLTTSIEGGLVLQATKQ